MILLSMTSWWAGLGGTEQVFWAIALTGTALFVIQLVLSLIGLDADLEADTDAGGDGLGIISLRSLISFATFFGWGAIGALGNGFTTPKAAMIGFLAGFVATALMVYIFTQLLQMQHSGTVDVYNAISKVAEVYIPIPEAKDGKGKIHLNIEEKLMEFDAISDGKEIKTGQKVKVLDVLNENVMLVTAL